MGSSWFGFESAWGFGSYEHIVAPSPLKIRAKKSLPFTSGRHRARHPVAACLLLALACACSGPRPTAPAAPAAPPKPRVEGPKLEDRGWGVLRSKPHGLKLALPEARSWLEAGGPVRGGASWELRHEPTGSTLSVRRWRASRLPRVDACEAELRARTPDLAVMDETNLVATRGVRAPEGFVTRITLVALPSDNGRLRGQVLAIGAGIGECLAAVARTECVTEAELAERLRLLDVALGHLRLAHIEDRVPSPLAPSP